MVIKLSLVDFCSDACEFFCVYVFYKSRNLPSHQWRSSSVLKTDRREVHGLIPKPACRPSLSKFSVVFFFFRNLRKYGLESHRKIPMEDILPIVPGPTNGKLDLNLQPQPQPKLFLISCSKYLKSNILFKLCF